MNVRRISHQYSSFTPLFHARPNNTHCERAAGHVISIQPRPVGFSLFCSSVLDPPRSVARTWVLRSRARVNREGTLDVLRELEADLCPLISRFIYLLGTHAPWRHVPNQLRHLTFVCRPRFFFSTPPDALVRNPRPRSSPSARTQNQKSEIRNGWADVRFHDCNG